MIMSDIKKQLTEWCVKQLPMIKGVGKETREKIEASLKAAELLEDCKHENLHLVQSASGNESWYECVVCGKQF